MNTDVSPEISIVVPAYNEEPVLRQLVDAVINVMRPFARPFELIVVDDGSIDGSRGLLHILKTETPELRAVFLGRNFGQSAAMTAGFDHARGEIIVTMDGDLQNNPADIPGMIKKLEKGYDLVCGWRQKRRDPFLSKRLPSFLANRLISILTKIKLNDYGCTLKVYKSVVAKNLLLYGELHRFIPVLTSLRGCRITEVPVKHNPRKTGKSKYGLGRAYRVILDLILMLFFQKFATQPLQLFGITGGGLFCAGTIIECYLTWLKLFGSEAIADRPLLLLGAILMITGIILFSIGLLAELIVRTYHESSGKRIYSVREVME